MRIRAAALSACLLLGLVSWPVSGAEGNTPVQHPAPPPEPTPPPPAPGPGPAPPPPAAPGPESQVSIGLSTDSVKLEGWYGAGPTASASVGVVLFGASGGETWAALPYTDSGGAWLSVAPRTGSDDATITVTGAGNLPRGTYTGRVVIHSAPALNTPQVIRVSFTVRDPTPSALRLSATRLTFEATAETQSPPDQYLVLSREGDLPLNWQVSVATASGGNWLSASPGSGENGAVLTVRAALGTLGPGTYSGSLLFSAPGATNSPVRVDVAFTVSRGVPVLQLTPSAVSLTARPEAAGPVSQQVRVSNAGAGAMNWQASVTTLNGGPWLSVTPGSGSGAGTMTLTADPGLLPAGAYVARVAVAADGAANSPAQLQVTLTVERQKPEVSAAGIVNAASLRAGPVAPGQLLSIFGSRLGPREGVAFRFDPAGERIPATLGGVRVAFDGVPAPLLYVSHTQINLQAPFELAGKRSARLRLEVEGMEAAEVDVEVTETAPGTFTLDGRYAAALNQDGGVNSPQRPAPPGSVIQLFLTGQGAVTPRVETGALAPTAPPFPAPGLPVTATVNTLQARVLYAGLAPALAGLLQVNLEIPATVGASDAVLVVVRVGEAASPSALIAVR